MFYWKTEELAEQIKEGNISEELKKNYYLATSVIMIVSTYLAMAVGIQNSMATLTECVLVLIITVLSINIIFATNHGNDGTDFISRVVMLGLPILIKLLVFAFTAGLIIGIYSGASGQTDLGMNGWDSTIISVLVQVIFFWRINVHLWYINT